ncbi:PH domain-containing protein [Streptomyces sp. CAU 1734]|uniref:PH domain-containing protein n=1 Tax=Streptomyces sp. CAU 1734 TaxID=3140360 RepID=UPI0032610AEB
MATESERALGGFIRNHPTDNDRRWRVAIGSLLAGMVLAGIAVPVTVNVFSGGGTGGHIAGLLWGGALVGLYGGGTGIVRTLRQHGEAFVLREGGLVHRRLGETRVVPWTAIRGVTERGQGHGLSRLMGWDVHLVIRLRDGGRLLLTGYTEDAPRLSAEIRAAVARADSPAPPGADRDPGAGSP